MLNEFPKKIEKKICYTQSPHQKYETRFVFIKSIHKKTFLSIMCIKCHTTHGSVFFFSSTEQCVYDYVYICVPLQNIVL